jgi:heme oxygenase
MPITKELLKQLREMADDPHRAIMFIDAMSRNTKALLDELERLQGEVHELTLQANYDSHYKRMYEEFHKRVNKGEEKHTHAAGMNPCWCGISICVLS